MAPPDYKIRNVAADEVDLVEGLWREMVEHHRKVVGDEWPVKDAGDAWQIRRDQYLGWLRAPGAWMLAAVESDSPAALGYAVVLVRPPGTTWDMGSEVGELESLAVAAAARGRGVGTALIAAARDLLAGQGISYWGVGVVAANADAVRLYEREGFRPYYLALHAQIPKR